MYYSELIQKFWQFNEKIDIGVVAIAMYLYLLKLANDTNGYAVTISDVKISKALCITRKTVKTTKQKLKKLGVIEYRTRNGLPCSYKIIVDYPFWEAGAENFPKQIEKKELNQEEKPSQNRKQKQDIKQDPKQEQQQTHFNSQSIQKKEENKEQLKYYDQKKQTLSKNLHRDLITPEDNSSQPIAPFPNIERQPHIPTLEEFLEYAQNLDSFVPPLHSELIQKYHFWKENGWKNNSNRPITNWKTTLKQILPYMKDHMNTKTNSVHSIPNIQIPEELENH